MIRVRDPKNLACAALFIAISVALAASALSLPIGRASEMGPGYFPLALAIILFVLGALLAATSLRVDGSPIGRFEWRGPLFVTLAIVAFAAMIGPLGFLPATVVTVLLSALASSRFRPMPALLLTAGLVIICWLIFIRGLGLPIQLIRW